jgi:hypothetical protein
MLADFTAPFPHLNRTFTDCHRSNSQLSTNHSQLNMHSQDTINHFIELRARSIPYSKIAGDLNITKATAVRWGHKYKVEIDALVAVEAEALRDRFFASREKEIEFLAKRLQRIEHEIDQRNPQYMATRELTDLARVTRARLDALCIEPKLPEEPAPAAMSSNA